MARTACTRRAAKKSSSKSSTTQQTVSKIIRDAKRRATRTLKLADDHPDDLYMEDRIDAFALANTGSVEQRADGRRVVNIPSFVFTPVPGIEGAYTKREVWSHADVTTAGAEWNRKATRRSATRKTRPR